MSALRPQPTQVSDSGPLNPVSTMPSSASSTSTSQLIIHQKQRLQLCLMHALNNLFQGETSFSQSELNRIAINFSAASKSSASPFSYWFSMHHNCIFGNYDVNVLIAAVESRGAEVVWYDRRKAETDLDLNPHKALMGIILNHPSERFAGLWKGRHWATLKKIGEVWYDLDSYLQAPSPILGGENEVKQFLKHSFAGGSEAFFVYKVEKDDTKEAIAELYPLPFVQRP